MRFYVSVGPRGLVFRIGMVASGVMGSLTYWYGSRRRSASLAERSSHSPALPGIATLAPHLPHSLTP
jgi:hypothetical protein